MIKRLVVLSLLLGLFVIPAALSARSVAAEAGGATDAVAVCREFADDGVLDEFGLTFGECVNIFAGMTTDGEFSARFIAGVCGQELNFEFLGVTNKGQCIKAVNALFA